MKCKVTNKVCHRSFDDAMIAADKIVRTGINIYKCEYCGKYHIGHSNNKEDAANRITALIKNGKRKKHKSFMKFISK